MTDAQAALAQVRKAMAACKRYGRAGVPVQADALAAILAHVEAQAAENERLTAERDELRDLLLRAGFVPCGIPACNCGSWHHRYGLPERMQEIKDALAEAGHELSNANGNLPINALKALVAERDALAAENERKDELLQQLRQWSEAYPPAPSSEAPTAAELEAFRLKYALGWTASENLLIAHLVAQLRCAAATPKES